MVGKYKILLSSLILILVMVLPVLPSAAAQKKFTFAYVPGMTTNPFYITVHLGMKEAAKELGVKLIYQGYKDWDYVEQVTVVKAVLAKDIDLLLLSPCDPKALIPVVEEAVERGVPVIEVANDVHSDLTLFRITSDDFEGGVMAGEALAKAINYKGKVYVDASLKGVIGDIQRLEGFKEAIKKYPDIELVSVQYSQDNTAKAASNMQSVLMAHPDLAGAFGCATPVAHGIAIGVRNLGKAGKVKVVAYDAQPLEIEDLREGIVDMLIAQPPYMHGYLSVKLGYLYLTGLRVGFPNLIVTRNKVITRENVDDPETQNWIYKEK